MVKVSIKKNIKPKKMKQKQKQTQKTNVVVNISSDVIKKKRGRPAKRSKIEKQITKPTSQQPVNKPTLQPIAPVIQSYNQPIFNKQSQPESSFRKALIEQNLQIEEPISKKTNDLEKVKIKEDKEDKTIKDGLINQRLSDQGDDTEEIQSLFNTNELQQLFISGLTTPTTSGYSINSNVLSPPPNTSNSILSESGINTPTPLSRPVNSQSLYDKLSELQPPIQEVTEPPFEIEEEAPLLIEEGEDQQIAPVNNDFEEEIPLATPKETTILETPKKEKTLISDQAAEEEVRPGDQYTTETLIENKDPSQPAETPSDYQGLQEFTTRIKAFPNNATLVAYIKRNNLTLPKEKNRDGYEKRLIDAFKDGKIDLANP
jgi:hypothetical protein